MIVSNDLSNRHHNRLQVVPLTSSDKPARPWEAVVWIGGRSRKVQADQIRTVAKERVSTKLADVTLAEMREVERAIRVPLDLG